MEPLPVPLSESLLCCGEPVISMPPSGSGSGWGDENGNENLMRVNKELDCQQEKMSSRKANDFLAGIFAVFPPALWMLPVLCYLDSEYT